MRKIKTPIKLYPFVAARYLIDDAAVTEYMTAVLDANNPDLLLLALADIKYAVTTLAPARTKLQLVKATARHLRSVQLRPKRIRKYCKHESVRYAA